jgi:hypothetical protein
MVVQSRCVVVAIRPILLKKSVIQNCLIIDG